MDQGNLVKFVRNLGPVLRCKGRIFAVDEIVSNILPACPGLVERRRRVLDDDVTIVLITDTVPRCKAVPHVVEIGYVEDGDAFVVVALVKARLLRLQVHGTWPDQVSFGAGAQHETGADEGEPDGVRPEGLQIELIPGGRSVVLIEFCGEAKLHLESQPIRLVGKHLDQTHADAEGVP